MRAKLRTAASFAKEVVQEFRRDRGSLFAAAISYYGLISLIPLLLLAIAVFGHIMGSYAEARHQVAVFLDNIIPVGAQSLEHSLEQFSRQSGLLGWIGVIGLLWTGMQVFVTLQEVMNIAVGSERAHGFLRTRGKALATVVVAGLLFALSIGITSMLAAGRSLHFGVDHGNVHFLWDFLGLLAAVILSIGAFACMYAFLPAQKIGFAGPAVGGVVAGILFELAKHVFKWYVSSFARFDVIYGPLAGAVVIVVWMYLVSIIAVLGAEIASVYAKWRHATAQ